MTVAKAQILKRERERETSNDENSKEYLLRVLKRERETSNCQQMRINWLYS